jgi:hypothetical protein
MCLGGMSLVSNKLVNVYLKDKCYIFFLAYLNSVVYLFIFEMYFYVHACWLLLCMTHYSFLGWFSMNLVNCFC